MPPPTALPGRFSDRPRTAPDAVHCLGTDGSVAWTLAESFASGVGACAPQMADLILPDRYREITIAGSCLTRNGTRTFVSKTCGSHWPASQRRGVSHRIGAISRCDYTATQVLIGFVRDISIAVETHISLTSSYAVLVCSGQSSPLRSGHKSWRMFCTVLMRC